MAQSAGDFESWLSTKLKELNTDDSVFGSYITGILEGEDSYDDKTEALEGILSEIIPEQDQQSDLCSQIVSRWNETQSHKLLAQPQTVKDNVEDKLTKIMEAQAQCTVQQRRRTEDENKLKQSILAHYAEVSDEEDDVDGNGTAAEESAGATGGGVDLSRNTNLEDILKTEKAKRDKLKQDAQKKKDKDKEDREKQKVAAAERKDKEKKRTQKGEKKR